MTYLGLYNKMIEVYRNQPNIRRNLCRFFQVNETADIPVVDILKNNINCNNNVELLIEFIKKFNYFGGIDEEDFKELNDYINEDTKQINRVVFAATDKLDVKLDVTYNEIEVIEDDSKYLVYKKDSYKTITWADLTEYFKMDNFKNRLEQTMKENSNELKFYRAYYTYVRQILEKNQDAKLIFPALLPQYALKNRSKTIYELGNRREVIHRVDFAMVLNGVVILIELDGYEHYSTKNTPYTTTYYNTNFEKISDERKIDRELVLEGYEVYRFLNYDIESKESEELVSYLGGFFGKLFKKHNINIIS